MSMLTRVVIASLTLATSLVSKGWRQGTYSSINIDPATGEPVGASYCSLGALRSAITTILEALGTINNVTTTTVGILTDIPSLNEVLVECKRLMAKAIQESQWKQDDAGEYTNNGDIVIRFNDATGRTHHHVESMMWQARQFAMLPPVEAETATATETQEGEF